MNYLTGFTCFTGFNADIVVSVLNQSEMQTVVSFAGTNKSNRELVSNMINYQFNQLLKYTNENCKTYGDRSIEKHIRDKWINIQSRMMSSELKNCINFKVFKEAFDVLKLFSHEIHFKKDDVFNLNCPIFITEMLSPDSDQGVWDAMDVDNTNPYPNRNLKVNSISKEFKKIGLLIEGDPNPRSLFSDPTRKTVSYFSSVNANKLINFSLTLIEGFSHSSFPCSINETSDKWDKINTLYKENLIDFHYRGKKINSIPLCDYRTEAQLYAYAEEQIKKSPVKDSQNLNGDFWFRYSGNHKYSFGKPQIVLCVVKSDKVINYLIPIETFCSTKEFDDCIQANLK